MVKPEEVQRAVGQRVVLRLAAGVTGAPRLTGRIVGALPALDGLVVTFEPDGGTPARQVTYHYHHIESISPAP